GMQLAALDRRHVLVSRQAVALAMEPQRASVNVDDLADGELIENTDGLGGIEPAHTLPYLDFAGAAEHGGSIHRASGGCLESSEPRRYTGGNLVRNGKWRPPGRRTGVTELVDEFLGNPRIAVGE